MVDVDRFKKFNDRHGHDVGDQVLRMVASRLKRVSGGGRGRPRKKPANGRPKKTRARGKLAVTVSIGVAEHSGVNPTAADVLKAADKALYRAKRGGRNRVSV